ncbi:SDR family NAD(P)-dependent oxidoreductase [Cellulomonas carbonis]|uniref:SDR family NAD(P)-dependent oxidoreductase n=1 Tax=Cellulomonas carbonis TaxID=1386092 RepID=UPI001998AEE9|nr:SDR family NAD(P)-dependent oxidoreductase [Cellulomonas carbonis]GGB99109.1 short-chain dehydrogenase [Cellulomonas carbonis]
MNEPRSVLVTGAGRGIGNAIALRLAASGWRVWAGVRTDVAAKALAEASGAITPVELDVTDRGHVAALDTVLPARLDALVNNVGIGVAGPLETLSPVDVHRQLDANLVGPLDVTRTVLPRLRRARGRIVFISSVNGRVSFPFTGIYNASKFAVEAVADCLRVELSPFGVQVALVEPGVVATDPWKHMDDLLDELEADLEPGLRSLYAGHFAGERRVLADLRRRAAPPDDVARAVEQELTRRRARPRTPVGRDARVILLMRTVLGARGMDRVWIRGLGLPRPPADGVPATRPPWPSGAAQAAPPTSAAADADAAPPASGGTRERPLPHP